jgi:hypothetical protein
MLQLTLSWNTASVFIHCVFKAQEHLLHAREDAVLFHKYQAKKKNDVGFEVLMAVAMKSPIFRDTTSKLGKLRPRQIPPAPSVLNCCLFHAYSSALKIEVTCSSKMFV